MNFLLTSPNQPSTLNPQTPGSRHHRRRSALDEFGAQPMVIPPQVAPKPPPRSRHPSRASMPPMTPSHVPIPTSPNFQSTAGAISLGTHDDSTVAPTRTRSRADSTNNDPLLRPTTGPTGDMYRHGSGSQSSLISNRTTGSMKLRYDPHTYVDPAFNVEPEGIESELDLSARAPSPSRKAVSAQIGGAMTNVWKRPRKEKKLKK